MYDSLGVSLSSYRIMDEKHCPTIMHIILFTIVLSISFFCPLDVGSEDRSRSVAAVVGREYLLRND